MRNHSIFFLLLLINVLIAPNAWAHCQIPCGIYTDEMRFSIIEEHISTIEKSMKQIQELSAADPINYNQLVRWISNKEQHAQEIQDIADHYFLTQRVKPVAEGDAKYDDYVVSLKLLHGMLVTAMKAKQTTDLAHVEQLRALTTEYRKHYFKDHHK